MQSTKSFKANSMEQNFNELLNLGFLPELASKVLRQTNGNVAMATAKLIAMHKSGHDVYESGNYGGKGTIKTI